MVSSYSRLSVAGKFIALVIGSFLSLTANATTMLINSTSQGSYANGSFATGGSGSPVGNYLTGLYDGPEYRSFFVFDLSSLAGTAVSATLELFNNGCAGTCAYVSPDATETLNLYAYAGNISALTGGTAGTAGFTDLADGLVYGSYTVSGAGNVSVMLNTDALAAINAVGGLFALGGALTTINGSANQYIFGDSINHGAQLLVNISTSVPEPATLALMGLGLVGLGVSRRKAKSHH